MPDSTATFPFNEEASSVDSVAILLIKRLVVRKPPSLPYRLQKDEWSKIRGYRPPS